MPDEALYGSPVSYPPTRYFREVPGGPVVPYVRLDGSADPVIVASRLAVISATPVVSAAPAYSVGDTVGGKMTFADAVRVATSGGLLQMVEVFCKSLQTAALDLVLFHSDPTASTFTDNAALAVAAADFDKLLGVVHLSDWTPLGTPSLLQADALAKPFKPGAGGTAIFGVLVARSALTLASTSDIKVALKILQD